MISVNPGLTRKALLLRLPLALQRKLRSEAFARGTSINRLCEEILSQGRPMDSSGGPLIHRIEKTFGPPMIGVVLFGSTARQEQTADSDVDLLLILETGTEVGRSLYNDWDRSFKSAPDQKLSPHFVTLPENALDGGSIWFEAAIDGRILLDKNGDVSKLLGSIREKIADREIERHWSHGHPYWVRAA